MSEGHSGSFPSAGPLPRVLVALDESAAAQRALAFALALHRQYGSELILCTAFDAAAAVAVAATPDGSFQTTQLILDEYRAAAVSLLADGLAQATAAGTRATTTLLEGRPAAAIADYSEQCAARAIVLGSKRRSGLQRAFAGSTAEGVLRLTHLPAFLVGETESNAPVSMESPFRRILVALDDSQAAGAALQAALDLAVAGDGNVLLCHAVDGRLVFDMAAANDFEAARIVDDLHRSAAALVERTREAAKRRGVTADGIVTDGRPADAILEAATERHADLIAIGTHGRSGLQRLFVGSVAAEVVRRSELPVMVVRAVADE